MTTIVKERLLLIFLWVTMCLVVWPSGGWPVNDDWAYTRAVQALKEGSFHYLDWQGMQLFSQVLWGYLFLGLGGEGIVGLRISMMVLALMGGIIVHAVLRLQGVDRWGSCLGALLLLFNPVYFHLSMTFMTDVFALTFCLAGFHRMERVRLKGYSHLDGVLAALFLAIAVLCRPTALIVPLGTILVQLGSGTADRRNLLFSILLLITTSLFLAWHDLYFLERIGRPWNYGFQLGSAIIEWTAPDGMDLQKIAYYLLNFFLFSGLSLVPLALPRLGKWSRKELLVAILFILLGQARMHWSGNNWPFTGDIWHAQGVGALLFPDHASARTDTSWVVGSLLVLASSLSLAKCIGHFRLLHPASFILLGSVVPLSIIYLSDRYFVFALAFLIILLMPRMPITGRAPGIVTLVALMCLVLFSVNEQVYFQGTRKGARALADGCGDLERKLDLNGGFEWNGYQRFEMAGYRADTPELSWPGTDRLRITPADHMPGFTCLDSVEVHDLVGLKNMRMRLFERVGP
ncbi:MAG: hypothetical protein JNL43_12830 [Flavobacteriales bacterium]|nr:hypothetical protein [Flavobacteriales bacterium]